MRCGLEGSESSKSLRNGGLQEKLREQRAVFDTSMKATPIFNKLVEIAGKTPRNFILDLRDSTRLLEAVSKA